DGIRDFHVTGVQTCALPIYCNPCNNSLTALIRRASPRYNPGDDACHASAENSTTLIAWHPRDPGPGYSHRTCRTPRRPCPPNCRSEERRVGKEGRCLDSVLL